MNADHNAKRAQAEQHPMERDQIRTAIDELVNGAVVGPLTVVRLAEVAGLPRWKLTHRHVDLKEAFQTAVGATPAGRANEERLEERLTAERAANETLRAEVRRLKEHLELYASVIAELASDLSDSQARAELLSNVKTLRPR